MLPDKPRDHRSTFPITARDTWLRKAYYIALSPITWIPIFSLLGVAYYLEFNWIATNILFLAVSTGISFYWASKNNSLQQRAIRELITESNIDQNRRLHLQATHLFENGFSFYGSTITSFLTLKKSIETALHTDHSLSEKKQEIENMVDTIVFGASDKIAALVNLEKQLGPKTPFAIANSHRKKIIQARLEVSNQLEEAFHTLTTTYENLAVILNPAHQIETSEPRNPECLVDSAINNLNKEKQLAERIRDRLELEDPF